jgi:hypothetical protein
MSTIKVAPAWIQALCWQRNHPRDSGDGVPETAQATSELEWSLVGPGIHYLGAAIIGDLALWVGRLASYFRSANFGPLPILEDANPNLTMLTAMIESLVIVREVHCHQAVGNPVNQQVHRERRTLCPAFCRVVSDRAPAFGEFLRKLIKGTTSIRTHNLRLGALNVRGARHDPRGHRRNKQ